MSGKGGERVCADCGLPIDSEHRVFWSSDGKPHHHTSGPMDTVDAACLSLLRAALERAKAERERLLTALMKAYPLVLHDGDCPAWGTARAPKRWPT